MVHARSWIGLCACLLFAVPGHATGQDIADIDYEHLSFRGFGFDLGYMYPDRVEPTATFGLRIDMGYAGPGLRIVPSIQYWKSPLEASEIGEFTARIEELVQDQTGNPIMLDLGTIEYSDIAIGLDGHIVWELPLDLLTFGGMGVTAHILDGDGVAIRGTIIEDLFDSVTPGFNLHVGAEYPVTDKFRIYTSGRYEVMPDLRYFKVQAGWQIMTGPNAPGEGRGG